MSSIFTRWFQKGKSRIQRRLDKSRDTLTFQPVFSASNIQYEVSHRTGAIACGGIGAIHRLVKYWGLDKAINQQLGLFKIHLPYHESDRVLAIAYNALCGGTCLQDLDLRRNDVNFLNALGARRIPDPTTAGDFCRRFTRSDLFALIDLINETRVGVWADQPDSFFDCARIDMDGTLVATTGQCKAGMDIAYDGTWGYHPLIVSLANTGEVLSIVNRTGSRPSYDEAAREADRALLLCVRAGFRKVLFRGDTDFSQTERLDGWDDNPRLRFYFGYDAAPNLKDIAEKLPASAWRPLVRPERYHVKTRLRHRPANVKERVVKEREFTNLVLVSEDVAEFDYRPSACRKTYRMVVVRKNLSVEKGEQMLYPDERYFFYITNERCCTRDEVVYEANDRCNQENHIAQLKSGCRALRAPVDNLESNWAYMVMTALAWNLKAWWALSLPAPPGRWQTRHQEEKERVLRMEFKSFVNAFVLLPCQIVRTGGKVVYRLLSWNPHVSIFFRLWDVVRC